MVSKGCWFSKDRAELTRMLAAEVLSPHQTHLGEFRLLSNVVFLVEPYLRESLLIGTSVSLL